VLLEGHFAGDGSTTYDSDLIIVKHDENYVSKNEERLKEADEGGKVPVNDTATQNDTKSEAGGS
jgi:cytochrome c-type biogenesis protein CcmE